MKLGIDVGGIRCRRQQALQPFHGLVERIAIGNMEKDPAAAECRQGDDFLPLPLRAK
jgi:hypothetical protein